MQRQQNALTVTNKSSKTAVCASSSLSQITAKRSKPFMDGEFAKQCIVKATETLCLPK
jgi:hypothetical protein